MYSQQLAILQQMIAKLAKKANLSMTPELHISKRERLASVNIFQRRITVGENLLDLWREGKFTDADVEATLAHEVGHLMDLSRESHSASFRNFIFASIWFVFGIFPFVVYAFFPFLEILAFSIIFATCWGFSLPRILRRIDVNVELQADKNAALYLVEPKKLADALTKINSLKTSTKTLGLMTMVGSFVGVITHPSFKERINHLNNLTPIYEA